jgi:hypothetical protein
MTEHTPPSSSNQVALSPANLKNGHSSKRNLQPIFRAMRKQIPAADFAALTQLILRRDRIKRFVDNALIGTKGLSDWDIFVRWWIDGRTLPQLVNREIAARQAVLVVAADEAREIERAARRAARPPKIAKPAIAAPSRPPTPIVATVKHRGELQAPKVRTKTRPGTGQAQQSADWRWQRYITPGGIG